MQGLFGIIARTAAPGALAERLRSLKARLDPPTHYSLHSWHGAPQMLLGRLGSQILEATPAVFENAKYVCLLEGEYSIAAQHSEFLRSTDGLAELYRERGEKLPQLLEGSFLITIYDRERQKLLLCNDRFGHRPVYFHHDKNGFLFAPTTRFGTLLGDLEPKTDLDAIAQILRYQQILDQRSLFQEFTLLPPASTLVFDLPSNSLEIQQYWSVNDIPLEQNIGWNEAVEHGTALFRRAVRRCFSSTRRIGVFLSGGLDSRMILGALGKDARGLPVVNYGIQSGSDVVYARQVAHAVGASYHHIQPEYPGWTQPFVRGFDRFSYTPLHYFNGGQNTIGKQASEYMDINLSGVPGDGILGTLPESSAMASVQSREWMLEEIDRYWTHGHFHPGAINLDEGETLLDPLFCRELGDRARAALATILDGLDCPYSRRHDFLYLLTRTRRCQGNLLYVERSVMENRVPFYDYELVTFFFSLPYRLRLNRQLQVAILNRISRRLSWIRASGDCIPPIRNRKILKLYYWSNRLQGIASRRISWIPKIPNKEINAWPYHTRMDSKDWIEELLLSGDAVSTSFYKADAIRSLLLRQQQDSARASWILAQLVTLELALRP